MYTAGREFIADSIARIGCAWDTQMEKFIQWFCAVRGVTAEGTDGGIWKTTIVGLDEGRMTNIDEKCFMKMGRRSRKTISAAQGHLRFIEVSTPT